MVHPKASDGQDNHIHSQKPIIVIVSNRGPFSFRAARDGSFKIQRGAGGLVTALGSLAERHDVLWVAAALSRGDRAWAKHNAKTASVVEGIRLRLVTAPAKTYNQYYNIVANPLLWFIQHQLWEIPRQPSLSHETWQAWESYRAVNTLFARDYC